MIHNLNEKINKFTNEIAQKSEETTKTKNEYKILLDKVSNHSKKMENLEFLNEEYF